MDTLSLNEYIKLKRKKERKQDSIKDLSKIIEEALKLEDAGDKEASMDLLKEYLEGEEQ